MFDKFVDLTTFTQIVSRLMVNEIRRRASNKTTKDACLNIVNFLEIPKQNQSNEKAESSSGNDILLSTLNLLYLFHQLWSNAYTCFLICHPLMKNKDTKQVMTLVTLNEDYYYSESFLSFLTRLCSHQASLHELTRRDDLALLFSAFTSWCAKHNQIWRQTAADVILVMAKSNAINCAYIHDKGCMASCIENMSRMNELSTSTSSASEIVDMLITIINFLMEITNNAPNSASVPLDDFKSSLGYHFLVDLVLKLESSIEENMNTVCRVITLVTQFAKVGVSELKPRPLSVNQLFIMDDFSMPRPTKKQSIRNLSAFNVLQTLWLKSKSSQLQDLILSALITLYRDDRANYFILDSQNTLSQFAEKLYLRSFKIQFVIYELRYVPCKELISISIIIKSKHSFESSLICLRTLLSIIKFNPIFRDVYREVGLLDIITSLLVTNSQQILNDTQVDEKELQLLEATMELTYNMLLGPCNQNCLLFHEAFGPKYVFNFLPQTNSKISKQIRKLSFLIIQQLILSNNGEEHLASLFALMHNSTSCTNPADNTIHLTLPQELSLKSSILKSLLIVLKESHRCRALFRKVGGFVYVMSVLVGMEGSLICIDSDKSSEDCQHWNGIEKKKIWNLLRYVFLTLTTAMRFEPANARFFSAEMCPSSLTDSIRLLGCFSNDMSLRDDTSVVSSVHTAEYSEIFSCSLSEIPQKPEMKNTHCVCFVMRFLYDMALDISDKQQPQSQTILKNIQNPQSKQTEVKNANYVAKRPPMLSLSGSSFSTDPPVIVHSSVVIGMLHLIPSINDNELRCYILEIIRLLLKSERNQQVMCEAGLVTEILSDRFNIALSNEKHALYPALQYILERLSAQQIQPRELRTFLRLSHPLNCLPFDDIHKTKNGKPMNQREGGMIPLSRIKTLVSMTTPKDTNNQNFLHPPFVEFDMSQEGFSCLFLPSVAPASTPGSSAGATNILAGAISGVEGVSLTGNSGGVHGGIGTGERTFPPQNGLTFLSWICVEKFSNLSEEAHNARLLTILRGSGSGREYSCLQIQISARDKALLISTQEIPIFGDGDLLQPSVPVTHDSDHNLRVWSPELIQESQWHNIVVVLNRALLKNSTCSVFIDGAHVTSQKLHYISSGVGGSNIIGNGNTSYVNGFIGTPPQWRKQSKLVWKQGPCHLLEEPLSPSLVSHIYSLGPNYIGSFQGCFASVSVGVVPHASSQQQIQEDKVIFGLNARATSVMTLAKMRRVYSRFDSRQISKILGISTHENATPIYVLHNSAGHLCGPSRSLGAILIGYIGARCFIPKPVSVTIHDIGGCSLLLGLVASSHDVESLYASVKALVCVLKVNKQLVLEMERIKGYQTLAMLFRRKKQYLNSHVLHLTFNLVGTLDVYRKNDNHSNDIQNTKAFKDLLCDQIDLWVQNDLLKSLLEHFNELLLESGQYHSQVELKSKNIKVLRELGLLPRLLQLLWDLKLTDSKIMSIIKSLIFVLLNQTPRQCDLLYFGQFISATLPTNGESEKADEVLELRNSLLKIVLQLMTRNVHQQVNHAIQEELTRILGFDWFLLFLQGSYLHKDTVAIGLVNVMVLISNPFLYMRFKEASSNGGWLKDTETVFSNRLGVQLLGFNVGGVMPSTPASPSFMGSSGAALLTTSKSNCGVRIIRNDIFTIPGFQHLGWLMSAHVQKPQ
ncbi:PH domain associated with Beige/BEACH domain containing protein-like protein, partial [Leptotrombidium deliense]